MPRRVNAIQRDPNLAKAFDNIASMFAPPSGSDFAASANAQATNQKAARLAEIYNYAKDPNFNRELAERKAIAAGIYNPNQSFHSVDQGNLTLRSNNAADNQRALQTNAADNQRAIEVQAMSPVARDAVAPAMPSIATRRGLPELANPRFGVIAAAPGERNFLPDGRVLDGVQKPMTVDELNAQVAQGLMNSGVITPEQYFNTSRNVTTIVDDKGKIRSSTEAALNNAKALPPAPTGGARKDGMALLSDGRRVPVTRAPDGLRWQMQDGTFVPPEAQVFDMAKPTGTNDQIGITSSNLTAANKLQAAIDGADFTVRNMREILASNPNVAGVPGRVKGVLQSLASSAEQSFKAFAAENPNAPISLAEARDRLSRAAGGYDPNIVRLQSGIMDLAYARAQIANPSGEVSRQAFERALESFGQTYLSSQQDLETGLAAFEKDSLGAARVQLQSLRRGSGGQPGAPAPAGASPPAAGGVTTINTPAGAVTIQRVP